MANHWRAVTKSLRGTPIYLFIARPRLSEWNSVSTRISTLSFFFGGGDFCITSTFNFGLIFSTREEKELTIFHILTFKQNCMTLTSSNTSELTVWHEGAAPILAEDWFELVRIRTSLKNTVNGRHKQHTLACQKIYTKIYKFWEDFVVSLRLFSMYISIL